MARVFASLVALAILAPALTFAADGTVKIKFTLDGAVPTPPKIKQDKDVAFCGPKMLVDEGLVVGKEKGIQNIFVYLTASGAMAPKSEAALKALPKEVKVDNLGCRYEPRVTLLHTSQTLIIGNPDPIGHNSKGDFFKNPGFNDLIPAGGSIKKELKLNESRPLPLSCTIHNWMGGYLLIRDNPFFGASNDKGEVTIANVPEGKHQFTIWHERPGYVTKAKQKGKDVAWALGKITIEVKGETDLGEFLIPVSTFDKK